MSLVGEVVTSRGNPRVKQLRAAFAGQARLASGMVAIEGEHLVQEALRAGLPLKTIFLSERRAAPGWLPRGLETVRLAQDVFTSCADTQSPQGMAALLVPPVRTLADMLVGTPLLLIAAGLQDPGNLGTLIRSAEAFGATGVLLTPGTVGAWNQKALRASAGSIFRMPVATVHTGDFADLIAAGVQLFAALKDGATPVYEADLRGPAAFLLGNEGAGLAPEWLALADRRVTIPCPGAVESLNAAVAGSLLLYEASRQRGAR